MANLIAPSPPVQSFPCPVGITTISGKPAVWIKSPKTGKVLTFCDAWKPQLPDRVWGRIVSAVSKSKPTVTFTRDELAKLAALYPQPKLKPRLVMPAGNFAGTTLDPSFSPHFARSL
jgi:hypothetical protein